MEVTQVESHQMAAVLLGICRINSLHFRKFPRFSFETLEQAVLSEHAATEGALTLCLPTVTELSVPACVCVCE